MTYEPDQVIGGENATEATEAAGVTEATEAVHTDAVRGGIQTAAAGLPDARRYRPLVGGIGIGPDTSVAGGPVGTLGMIVADPGTGKRMGLTNHHIFYGGGPFSQIDVVQPAWGELAPGFIGSLIRSVFSAEADAAAIEIDPRIPVSCQVQDLGLLGGSVEPVKGMKVRKRGRSTYWTYGVIDNVDQECHITLPNGKRHTFQHQFMVVCDPPDAGSAFADDGDSGAVIVTEDAQVVGLLLGTHTDDNGVTRGVATKFGTVMDKLGVAMAYEGIGNWDMAGPGDRGFAFDRDGKGHPDHLVFYRPGQGAAFVIARNGGGFRPLYRQGKNGSGIGGFDLDSGLDRAFAFEYNFDPTKTYTILDHIAIYRPGSGQFWILGKKTGQDGKLDFERVFPPNPTVKDPPHDGIAGFTFKDEADRAFAYDYYGTGHLSQLALYRPGQKMFWIVGRGGPNFQRAFPTPVPRIPRATASAATRSTTPPTAPSPTTRPRPRHRTTSSCTGPARRCAGSSGPRSSRTATWPPRRPSNGSSRTRRFTTRSPRVSAATRWTAMPTGSSPSTTTARATPTTSSCTGPRRRSSGSSVPRSRAASSSTRWPSSACTRTRPSKIRRTRALPATTSARRPTGPSPTTISTPARWTTWSCTAPSGAPAGSSGARGWTAS